MKSSNHLQHRSPSDTTPETSMLLLFNRDPHCLSVTIQKPFEDITIKDVLDSAYKELRDHQTLLDKLTTIPKYSPVVRENLQLRVITDEVRIDAHTKRVAANTEIAIVIYCHRMPYSPSPHPEKPTNKLGPGTRLTVGI